MNRTNKRIVDTLFEGGYIMKWLSFSGRKIYRVFDAKSNPLFSVSRGVIDSSLLFSQILKSDKVGRLTFNLRAVRSLHGKNYVKKRYKETRINSPKQS